LTELHYKKFTLLPLISDKLRILSRKKLFPTPFSPITVAKHTSLVEYFFINYENFGPISRTLDI